MTMRQRDRPTRIKVRIIVAPYVWEIIVTGSPSNYAAATRIVLAVSALFSNVASSHFRIFKISQVPAHPALSVAEKPPVQKSM